MTVWSPIVASAASYRDDVRSVGVVADHEERLATLKRAAVRTTEVLLERLGPEAADPVG